MLAERLTYLLKFADVSLLRLDDGLAECVISRNGKSVSAMGATVDAAVYGAFDLACEESLVPADAV
ncbi:MAG: hypothetical protein JSS27_01060 [Planctomycetes bacterium]|nr:hypothetical protein [Planctomycetota bacterium]